MDLKDKFNKFYEVSGKDRATKIKKDLTSLGFKIVKAESNDDITIYNHKNLDKHYQLAVQFAGSGVMIRSDKGRSTGDFAVSDTVGTVKGALNVLANFIKKDLSDYIAEEKEESDLREMSKKEAPTILKKMLADLKIDVAAFGKNKIFKDLDDKAVNAVIKAGIKYQLSVENLLDTI